MVRCRRHAMLASKAAERPCPAWRIPMMPNVCRKSVRTMAQLVFSAALLAVPAAGRTQAQPATPAPAAHAEHAHAAAPAAEVPAGKRWATDAPLHAGKIGRASCRA